MWIYQAYTRASTPSNFHKCGDDIRKIWKEIQKPILKLEKFEEIEEMLKGNFGENPIELWDKDKTYADIDFLFFW